MPDQAIERVQQDIEKLEVEAATLKAEVVNLKLQLSELKYEVAAVDVELKSSVAIVNKDVLNITGKFSWIWKIGSAAIVGGVVTFVMNGGLQLS